MNVEMMSIAYTLGWVFSVGTLVLSILWVQRYARNKHGMKWALQITNTCFVFDYVEGKFSKTQGTVVVVKDDKVYKPLLSRQYKAFKVTLPMDYTWEDFLSFIAVEELPRWYAQDNLQTLEYFKLAMAGKLENDNSGISISSVSMSPMFKGMSIQERHARIIGSRSSVKHYMLSTQ